MRVSWGKGQDRGSGESGWGVDAMIVGGWGRGESVQPHLLQSKSLLLLQYFCHYYTYLCRHFYNLAGTSKAILLTRFTQPIQ